MVAADGDPGNRESKRTATEFVARYKINGRAFKLHETSRFEQLEGRWLYVDGKMNE